MIQPNHPFPHTAQPRVRFGNTAPLPVKADSIAAEPEAPANPENSFFPPQFPSTQKKTTPAQTNKPTLLSKLTGLFSAKSQMTDLEKDFDTAITLLLDKQTAGRIDLCLDQPIRAGTIQVNSRSYPTQIKDIKIDGKDYEFIRQDGVINPDSDSKRWMNSYRLRPKGGKTAFLLCDIGKSTTYENTDVSFDLVSKNRYLRKKSKKFFYPTWKAIQEGIKHQAEYEKAKKINAVGGIQI